MAKKGLGKGIDVLIPQAKEKTKYKDKRSYQRGC